MMDTKEFRSLMHCTRLTVYRWCKHGVIPCVKVGRKLLFKRSDVENLIQHNMRNKTSLEGDFLVCR